jgi:hypothetical protein
LGDLLIVRTDYVIYFWVMLDSKLHFHPHVNYLHSQALRLLGLIRFITCNFSSLVSLKVLYITLIRSKLEYASVIWNCVTLSDSNKLENVLVKRKFGINLFSPTSFVIINQYWIIYILKRFSECNKILTLYFLLTFSRTKLPVVL